MDEVDLLLRSQALAPERAKLQEDRMLRKLQEEKTDIDILLEEQRPAPPMPMGQYVDLGAFGADDKDPCATAESLIQALPAKWKALKTKVEAWTPTDQAKVTKMQALAKDMDTWRVNYMDLANTHGSNLSSWLLGGSWFWASQCDALVIQLRTFENQLVTMNNQYATISELPSVPGLDKPSPDVKPSGPWERTKDLAWDLLKIGTIGLGVWYGGKLLYQYLDTTSRRKRR